MNEIFKAYGNFDVVAGAFAFYSEIHARNGRLDGYVKPFFTDMDVYDSRQDREKPFLQQVYEGLVGAVATVLSPNDDLATAVEVSGQIDQPNVSTWQAVIGILRNAFVRAIVRGFEDEAQKPR
jgi:hypothetical protein